jgi:glutathione S-transferase
MKLYYTPGACSLSPHIALREAQLPFELEQVDLGAKKILSNDQSYLTVNPKGYVPALVLDDGELITEGAVIVQYVADQRPDLRLAPPAGTSARRRLQEWLHFIATELHKAFGPIYNPKASADLKQALKERLLSRFAFLAHGLDGKDFLLGDSFSVADGYAYYVLRSLRRLDPTALEQTKPLAAYFDRLASRPAVQAALTAEGIPA